jgi:hypothetical protein
MQPLVIPANVRWINVDLTGAAGGGTGGTLGRGARVEATVQVTEGSTLYIFVGSQGSYTVNPNGNNPGGWNGGGYGYAGAGGGGATDIRMGGADLSNRIVVAGGGGGLYPPCHTPLAGDAGMIGQNGALGECAGSVGGGAFQTTGGSSCATSTAGTLGAGGNGGSSGGGGGGGGYYGGKTYLFFSKH